MQWWVGKAGPKHECYVKDQPWRKQQGGQEVLQGDGWNGGGDWGDEQNAGGSWGG